MACLVVEGALQPLTGLAGLNHLVATGLSHLALVVAGPAVEEAVVLGGEGGVAQQGDCQVTAVLLLRNLGGKQSVRTPRRGWRVWGYLVEVVGVVEGPPPEGGRRVGSDSAENFCLHVEWEEDGLEV